MSDVEGDDVGVAATAVSSSGPMDINTAIQVIAMRRCTYVFYLVNIYLSILKNK